MVIIHKKDGSLWLCIDYRQLKRRSFHYTHQLLHIEEVLDTLGKATLFNTLDLTSGYWQVEVDLSIYDPNGFLSV